MSKRLERWEWPHGHPRNLYVPRRHLKILSSHAHTVSRVTSSGFSTDEGLRVMRNILAKYRRQKAALVINYVINYVSINTNVSLLRVIFLLFSIKNLYWCFYLLSFFLNFAASAVCLSILQVSRISFVLTTKKTKTFQSIEKYAHTAG